MKRITKDIKITQGSKAMRKKKRSLDLTIRSSGNNRKMANSGREESWFRNWRRECTSIVFREKVGTTSKEINRILVFGEGGDKRMLKKIQLRPKSVYKKKETRW